MAPIKRVDPNVLRDIRARILEKWLHDLTEVLIEICEARGHLADSRWDYLLTILRRMIEDEKDNLPRKKK